jgi:hypothetical protein
MKRKCFGIAGALVVLLTLSLVLAGCDTGTGSDNNGYQQGDNTGGNNTGGDDTGGNNGGGTGGTTAPSAPSGVTATSASSSSISVSWSAVSGATSYKIYYEIGSSSTKNLAGTAYGTSYTHTGLTAETTYYYYIKAVNSVGESGYSSYSSNASATTSSGGSSSTPSRPTSVSGSITATTITVRFSFGSTVQNIVVEAWNRVNRSWKTLTTLSGSATSYSISPYRNYIVSGNVVAGNGKDGPQGITDETDLVFVRVRGKNESTTGPAKSVAFDAFLQDVYTDLNSVYDN